MDGYTASGAVLAWDVEAGWGVLAAAATPGGCFVHFSALEQPGYRSLTVGQQVWFEFEPTADQDGYRFRATRVVSGQAELSKPPPAAPGPSDAYASRWMIDWD